MRNAEKARERIRDAVLTNTQSFGTKNFYLGGRGFAQIIWPESPNA